MTSTVPTSGSRWSTRFRPTQVAAEFQVRVSQAASRSEDDRARRANSPALIANQPQPTGAIALDGDVLAQVLNSFSKWCPVGDRGFVVIAQGPKCPDPSNGQDPNHRRGPKRYESAHGINQPDQWRAARRFCRSTRWTIVGSTAASSIADFSHPPHDVRPLHNGRRRRKRSVPCKFDATPRPRPIPGRRHRTCSPSSRRRASVNRDNGSTTPDCTEQSLRQKQAEIDLKTRRRVQQGRFLHVAISRCADLPVGSLLPSRQSYRLTMF